MCRTELRSMCVFRALLRRYNADLPRMGVDKVALALSLWLLGSG